MSKGIDATKDGNFSEWYTQVMTKADLADYTSVSGCIAYKPGSYAIWEKIKEVTDKQFKRIGLQNCYFPIFIPEKLLQKEEKHVEHFSAEVAWVTHGGDTKLGERLAIRPTSETIMYESYAKWIRSHNDLPLRFNQWNNVVRWEFKHPTPFLRGREFLWNEGHTCFSSQKEAEAEGKDIIAIYSDVCENYLALPSLIGRKSEKEKFAGAEYTISMEYVMPNGKGIQGPDFHHDGQNFAKAFDISFTDDKGKKDFVWQNTFAITTRMLGVLFAVHGDDKGLVLPPKIAPTQVVIVPILFDDSKEKVLSECDKLNLQLEKQGISVNLDDRNYYSPGWKFNEWEMKGIPIRIEIGPKDIAAKKAMVVRRDSGEKESVSLSSVVKEVPKILEKIQDNLFRKAKKFLKSSIVEVKNVKQAIAAFEDKKIVYAPWCGLPSCEESFKDQTGGKSLNSPLKQPAVKGKCFHCSQKAQRMFYFGKSY
ncbi:MAG: proline--tRNA ligase [Nanoarchaeota archaeon]|nr:proline--tRNA ligase [Nanoarchaeota archaeon]